MRLKRLYDATLGKLHTAARYAMAIGALTAVALYITAIFTRVIAPHVDYVTAITMHQTCLEAAPASVVVGIVAGLLGDLILRDQEKKGR